MRGLSLAIVSGVLAVLAIALVASHSASLAQDTEDPSPTPEATFRAIHGWPGARSNPAGLYSWHPSGIRWMHAGPVEITFEILDEFGQLPVQNIAVAGSMFDHQYSAVPERVADVRLQAWRLDVEGSQVVIIVKSFPETPPALLAEAEAVVESIRVEPADTLTGYRLVFELPAGWDSG